MNSSNSEINNPRYSGRVLIGCDTPGVGFVTIQEIEGKRHRPVWDESTEVEYIGRCKQKAESLAKEIITQALARAAVEAQAIRDQAGAEVAQAVAQAEAEAQARLDAEVTVHAQAMAGLLTGIQGLGREVWEARRHDFATLTTTFTRKALAVEMDTRRAEILERLMDEACSTLDSHREFTLKVSPQDFELAKALMEQLQIEHPDLGQWKLSTDAALSMGGVILETPEMLIDNAIGNRMALLTPYLEQLGLPMEPSESISEGMIKAGEEPRGERT